MRQRFRQRPKTTTTTTTTTPAAARSENCNSVNQSSSSSSSTPSNNAFTIELPNTKYNGNCGSSNSNPSIPTILWVVGLGMAFHPIAWIVLLMYRNSDWRRDNLLITQQRQGQQSSFVSFLIQVLDLLAVCILDFTPKFTSTLLTIFLASSSLYVGIKCLNTKQQPR